MSESESKQGLNLGNVVIDIFIIILLIVGVWYLREAFIGIPIIENIAIAIFIISGAGILVLLAVAIIGILNRKNAE